MNPSITSRSFSFLSIAKLALLKLTLLSTAMLFVPTAFAQTTDYDNFPVCLDINTYLPRYISSLQYFLKHDNADWNNEWTLRDELGYTYPKPAYKYFPKKNGLATFQLKSIKITTVPFHLKDDKGDPNENHPIIESVSCEYTDPNVSGSLYLELKPSGKIEVIDEENPNKDQDGKEITDRTVRYVSRGGSINAYSQWEYDKKAVFVTAFTCSDPEKLKTSCGGWSFQRTIQNNGFWSHAFAKCNRNWYRCYFNDSYNWSYAANLRKKNNTITYDYYNRADSANCKSAVEFGTSWCKVPNTTKAYCDKPTCDAEITAINNIIGEHDGKEGMGIYVRACWAEPKRYVWTRRQWDKGYEECVNKQNPVGSWPNYGITGLPEHLWR